MHKTPIHPKVLLKHRGEVLEIDKDIAPIIQKLWSHKIETVSCCQASCGNMCRKRHKFQPIKNSNGTIVNHTVNPCTHLAYISFNTVRDAEKFANLFNYHKDKRRILGHGKSKKDPDMWNWNYYREFVNNKCFTWAVIIFPSKDFEMIIKVLDKTLINRK